MLSDSFNALAACTCPERFHILEKQTLTTIVSSCGTYGGAADRFSDWTRFSKKKSSYIIGSATAMPVCITLCALLGVLTASATTERYGKPMWQPLVILDFAQREHYTAGGRALTFFAGLSIWSHQVFVNVTQNNVGAGMDLAGVFPRYISMRRGAILLTFAGIIVQPWRFFTQATVFISVISSFAGQCPYLHRSDVLIMCSVRFCLHCHSHSRLLGDPQAYVENPRFVSQHQKSYKFQKLV